MAQASGQMFHPSISDSILAQLQFGQGSSVGEHRGQLFRAAITNVILSEIEHLQRSADRRGCLERVS